MKFCTLFAEANLHFLLLVSFSRIVFICSCFILAVQQKLAFQTNLGLSCYFQNIDCREICHWENVSKGKKGMFRLTAPRWQFLVVNIRLISLL